MAIGLRARVARLESRAGPGTAKRVRLAGVVTLLLRQEEPAARVRAEDLPVRWRGLADLVAASYEHRGA